METLRYWVGSLFGINKTMPTGKCAVVTNSMANNYSPTRRVGTVKSMSPELLASLRKVRKMEQFVGITSAHLQKIFKLPAATADVLAPLCWAACQKHEINTALRVSAFLANIGDESGGLTRFVENLNYSAVGLARTWPNRYATRGTNGALLPGIPNQLAKSIGGNAKAIANATYANRMGNGAPTTNDGWNYRGRSPMGITGKDAYVKAAAKYGIDFVNHPEKMEDPTVGFELSASYWAENNINRYADVGDFDGCCDCVNIGKKTKKEGDAIGYPARKAYYNALKALYVIA